MVRTVREGLQDRRGLQVRMVRTVREGRPARRVLKA
jgi:hypothetical protein